MLTCPLIGTRWCQGCTGKTEDGYPACTVDVVSLEKLRQEQRPYTAEEARIWAELPTR
jgi:hypothetical protein